MSRRLTLLLCAIALVMAGCSRGPQGPAAGLPTAPSAATASLLGPTPVAPGGIAGPMDAVFPGRNDTFDFRQLLEIKYESGLRRSASTTFVDREGDVVWVQEYIRYRVNGCDHASAVQRVLAQIDGNPPGAVCGTAATGEIAFPQRTDLLDFRRQLELKYQQMQRSLTVTFVDIEGAVIWIQEYLRYRLNGCDHITAAQKVFSQIDGNGVAPTCYVPPEKCNYRLTPGSREVGGAGGTFEVDLFRVTGSNCPWTVSSDQSWLTITPPATGEGPARVTYTVGLNTTNSRRTANIRFDWEGGSTNHIVFQGGSYLDTTITLTDSFRSGSQLVTSCYIRSTATPCTLTSLASPPGAATYQWRVEYLYPNLITHTQFNASNVFTFTQQCGGSGATADGTDATMTVTLIITEANGAVHTIVREFGIRFFLC